MDVTYRLIEINDTNGWLPIGVAIPHEGEIGVFLLGREGVRKIADAGIESLAERHLWAPNLRWGATLRCSTEEANEPRLLLLERLFKSEHGTKEFPLDEIIKRGATMEEIARLKEPIARTPQQALHALKLGNSRYFSGRTNVNLSPLERRAQIIAQTPFAIIVGCSDSRVPIEIVFDQGAGNLFIVRIAGNLAGRYGAGTIEYGIRHLKSHLVVIMGHEGCGAVAAAMLPESARAAESENLRTLLKNIAPAVENLPQIRDRKARMREAVISNVRLQVHNLRQNPVIQEAEDKGQIAVVGAYYSITSGAVDFFESEEELALEPPRAHAHAAAH